MASGNADIAAVFEEIADLLEIRGDNPFRVRAYRNAARALAGYPQDLVGLIERGEALPKIPGVGADLAAKIREIAATGTAALLEQLHRELPAALTELLKVPGLGPRRVKALHERLGVSTAADLRRALAAGALRGLPGFGARTEARIARALAMQATEPQRFKISVAARCADALLAHLKKASGVCEAAAAGSLRRGRDTVGDLDLVVAADAGSPAIEWLCGYEEVRTVLARGQTRGSVVLENGLQVDLRLVPPCSYGAALHYFTGSKAHNIALRRLGQALGLKINEYGVFRGSRRVAGESEESVFRAVGLPWIPPELREDRGEIEAAREGRLPELVRREDLRGDLHVHTNASDGRASLREMAAAARAAGLEYIAITEHSRRLAVARGLDAARLARHCERIERLNAELPGLTLLKGVEVDILEDGSLDLPEAALAQLDLVVGAVHSAFELPRERQTERIVRAMNRRYFTVLAHPAGRLIGARAPCAVDMARIVREARRRGCFLEVNSQPDRLDLEDVYCQMARAEGVAVCVNSDAHGTADFANLGYGVLQARRGWLGKSGVLNTRPLAELWPLLRRTMG